MNKKKELNQGKKEQQLTFSHKVLFYSYLIYFVTVILFILFQK